jgi:hypothetical protein
MPKHDLGKLIAQGSRAASTNRVLSAEVVDVTDRGVNLDLGSETYFLDAPCPDTYTDRKAGDRVAVQIRAGQPVVLWRLGDDTAADNVNPIASVAWGPTAPTAPWMTYSSLRWKARADGRVDLFFVKPSTDTTQPIPAPVTLTPTSIASYINRHLSHHGRATQGPSTPGPHAGSTYATSWRGGFFYGTKIADACAGKTLASMQLKLTRQRGIGADRPRPAQVWLHNFVSAPADLWGMTDGPIPGLALSPGGTRLWDVPADWASQLAAGTAKGLAVYTSEPDDYLSLMDGSIVLTFA